MPVTPSGAVPMKAGSLIRVSTGLPRAAAWAWRSEEGITMAGFSSVCVCVMEIPFIDSPVVVEECRRKGVPKA